jgi:hypothetical protein
VRNRAADQPEVNPFRPGEVDRLDGGGDQPVADRGAVGGEHHVGAGLQDAHLLPHRTGGAAQVGLGDHIEHDLASRADHDRGWSERPDSAADAEVDRNGTGDQSEVASRGGQRRQPGHQPGPDQKPGRRRREYSGHAVQSSPAA